MRRPTRSAPLALLLSAMLALAACQSSEERAEGYYQDALALIEKGDTDRAIVELRNVFQQDPGHREARRALAELVLAKGNRQEAYSQYLRLAEQYPDDLDARLALARIAFLASSWDEVERHGAKAEELAPDDPQVRIITTARAYRDAAEADDEPARREAARQAAAMLPDHPDSLVLRNIGIDAAMRDGDFATALDGIDWMIAREPDNPRYYQERLKVLARLGDAEAIETQLREMVERFPDDVNHKATLVRFYLAQDDLDGAEAFLRELAAASAPDDPGSTVDLIRFLAERRGVEAARAEIDKAIAERPDPVPFQVIGAGLDFSAGRQDAAIATLEGILAGAEPSEQTRNIKVTLARMLLATGNEVGARTRVEEVLAEAPSQPEALKMQAAWMIEADDTDAAIGALRIALDQAPEDAQAMTLMAQAYSRSGRSELAKEFLALAVDASGNAPDETIRYARVLIGEERYLPAEDILLSALRLAPANADLLVTLGQLYLGMEDFGRAQGVADALRRMDSPAARQAADRIEAERLNRERGTEEAIGFLEQAAQAADATLASQIALIRARLGTGDAAGALELARTLKRENPETEGIDVVLAAVETANGNLDRAEELYRGLLEATPERPQIWLNLAGLYQRRGARDQAKDLVAEGLTHMPDAPRLLWAQASYMEQDGDIDGAIGIYEKLYAQDSNSVIVANNLASLLASYRDDAESLERAWTVARRLRDTEIPAMQDTYGWILQRRGDSEEALPYLESAARGVPNDPLVHYHLGQAYLSLERNDAALAAFRKAVDLAGPGDRRPQIETARAEAARLEALPAPSDD